MHPSAGRVRVVEGLAPVNRGEGDCDRAPSRAGGRGWASPPRQRELSVRFSGFTGGVSA